MEEMFTQVSLYFYYGTITKDYWKRRHPQDSLQQFEKALLGREKFFARLGKIGYTVRTKPVAMIFRDDLGKSVPKCNFDVELSIDVMDSLNDLDVLVLGSGDGDFIPLVKRLKASRKQTYAICPEAQFNSELWKVVGQYDYLNNLISLVPDLTEEKK